MADTMGRRSGRGHSVAPILVALAPLSAGVGHKPWPTTTNVATGATTLVAGGPVDTPTPTEGCVSTAGSPEDGAPTS